jgi:predicted metal-dependent phosphoesterase TrpH
VTEDAGAAVDLHVKVLDDAVVERAKERGLDALVYAPHFTRWPAVRRRAERFSDDDLLVVPARELFTGHWTDRRHVLALALEEPVPDFLTLDGTMAELRRQDATVLAPHPEFLTVGLEEDQVRAHREQFAAVEVYNTKGYRRYDRRAREVAAAADLPGFASSYAHLRGSVGEAWTRFPDPVDDESDLLAGLAEGTFDPVHRTGLAHGGRRALEFAHLGWENSWQKLDRVFLSGTAPTHPGHVAYEGRFDDVRVY